MLQILTKKVQAHSNQQEDGETRSEEEEADICLKCLKSCHGLKLRIAVHHYHMLTQTQAAKLALSNLIILQTIADIKTCHFWMQQIVGAYFTWFPGNCVNTFLEPKS